jgi:PAS domain S-box-containing protein
MNDHRPLPVALIRSETLHDPGPTGVVSSRMNGPLPGSEVSDVKCDLRVLVVEDSEEDTLLLLRELKKGGYAVHHRRVCTRKAMAEALDGSEWDLILSDHRMPRFDSLTALEMVRSRGLDVPFIIVSAVIGEDIAVAAMKAGAHDYVMKGSPGRLLPAIARELHDAADRRNKRTAEEELKRSEEKYRGLVENAVAGVATTDIEGRLTFANRALSDGLGFGPEELMGKAFADFVHPEDVGKVAEAFLKTGTGPMKAMPLDFRVLRKDGQIIHCYTTPTASFLNGEIVGFNAIVYDISERKKAEEALRASEEKYRDLVENVSDLVFSTDLQGKITFMGPASERLVGYRPEEIVGRHFTDFVHRDDRERMRQQFPKVLSGALEPSEYRLVTKSGAVRWVRTSSRPARSGGKVVGLNGILNDITDRKIAEDTVRESEQRFRLFAENAKDIIFRVGLKPKPVVEYISPSVQALTGYAPEEFYANPILGFGLLPLFDNEGFETATGSKDLPAKPMTVQWKRKDNEVCWMELVNHPVLNASKEVVAFEGVARDITERKKVEDALRESEEKFRDLAEQSPNMIFINVRGKVVYANRRCEEVMGYDREEFYDPGFDFMTLTAPEHRTLVSEKYGAHLSGRDVSPYEYAIMTRTGRRIEVILSTKRISYGGEWALLGTLTDITESKKTERALRESEEKFRNLFESSPEGVVMFDLEGKLLDLNAAGATVLAVGRAEAVGKSFLDLPGILKEDVPMYKELLQSFAGGGAVAPFEAMMRSPQGERWQEVYPALLSKDGEPQAVQVILRDVTARKVADQKIRDSLKEKEVLLKEIHHRVKNNLQIIHSLLNMQSRRSKDPRILDALRESQNRVRTMALIHERLYRSTDLSEIDFKDYISRLVGELYLSFGVNADQLRLELDLQSVRLGIDIAIPCGLIVNELVSNSLKYGFPGGRRGRLKLSLVAVEDGTVRLAIGDDGAGLPAELNFRNTETLGLQLVCTLVDQLGGTIELDRAGGTEFLIVFNPARPEGD